VRSVGAEADSRAVVLFFRRFRRVGDHTMISGGHLKVWHYFEHVEQSPTYRPILRTKDRPLDPDNPWSTRPDTVVGPRARVDPAVRFLAGTDWDELPPRRRARPDRPVINLIQHIRHASDRDPRRAFLRFPAVRICVGPEVAEAIAATGEVRGPIITIPNAIDVAVDLSRPLEGRDIDIAVIGNKRPELTREIAARLERGQRRLQVIDGFVPRQVFLDVLARARLAVFVPRLHEGFYLPALEAMALGTPVVCPDAVGNRSFCLDGETCWFSPYDADALVARAEAAAAADAAVVGRIRERAAAEAGRHDLAGEGRAFLAVLADLPALWAAATSAPTSPA
jgi:glycosyltransferase involved in cell wall biosynthesis